MSVRRHNRRRRHRHPTSSYVDAAKITPKRDRAGQIIPGEYDREEWGEALFAPGPSSEDQMLSDVADHRAQLIFHKRVEASSGGQLEIVTKDGHTSTWSVSGRPNHWHMGTVINLERS